MKALSPRHIEYVRYRAAGKSACESARLAGFSKHTARDASSRLDRHPLIAAELTKVRAEIVEITKYEATQAMAELDRTIAFAERTENATAMARCVELKMKLNGLLIERVDQRVQGDFVFNMIRPQRKPSDVIDVTPAADPFA